MKFKIYKIIFFSTVTIIAFGCQNQNKKKEIPIFNNIHIRTLLNERVNSIKPSNQIEFSGVFVDLPCQFPIFRIIENPSYKIYINLPVGCNFRKIISKYKSDPEFADILVSDDSSYIYWTQRLDNSFITQSIIVLDENLLSISVINNDSTMQDSLFSIAGLRKRIVVSK